MFPMGNLLTLPNNEPEEPEIRFYYEPSHSNPNKPKPSPAPNELSSYRCTIDSSSDSDVQSPISSPELPRVKSTTWKKHWRTLTKREKDNLTQHAIRIQRVWRGVQTRKEWQRILRKTRIVKELVGTERSYVDSLDLVESVFCTHLKKAILEENLTSCTMDDIKSIFGEVAIIANFHAVLLKRLEDRLEKWHVKQTLGDILMDMHQFLPIYSSYLNQFDIIQERVANLRKESDFKSCMRIIEREKVLLFRNLESFLIMPVQRIPRYVMLLQELVKYSSLAERKADPSIAKALELVSEAATLVNERRRDAQRARDVLWVHLCHDPPVEGLVSPSRALYGEGTLFVSKDTLATLLGLQWPKISLQGEPNPSVDAEGLEHMLFQHTQAKYTRLQTRRAKAATKALQKTVNRSLARRAPCALQYFLFSDLLLLSIAHHIGSKMSLKPKEGSDIRYAALAPLALDVTSVRPAFSSLDGDGRCLEIVCKDLELLFLVNGSSPKEAATLLHMFQKRKDALDEIQRSRKEGVQQRALKRSGWAKESIEERYKQPTTHATGSRRKWTALRSKKE